MQLIFLFETTKKAKIDYKYIKGTIDFYFDSTLYKFTPIFACGKSNLISMKDTIKPHITNYKGKTEVILCADYDQNDDAQNEKIKKYCLKNNFHLVRMKYDIERVYYGYKPKKSRKQTLAYEFLKNRGKILNGKINLMENDISQNVNCSNLLLIVYKLLGEERIAKGISIKENKHILH